MKKREITQLGQVTEKGGLSIFMGEINQFLSQHKGQKIVATFTVLGKDASEALKGYYFNYVVPTFRSALLEAGDRKTLEQTADFLRQISPIMRKESVDITTSKYSHELRGIHDLTNPELLEHIEFLKQVAAEDYSTFIDDPK